MDYASDVRIDPRNLDWEWLRQTDLTLVYGQELAEAKRKVDKAKEAMDVEESKALLRAFETVEKPVDKVKATADIDPIYLKRVAEYNQAKYEAGLVQAAYDAISMKKPALENLTRLLLSDLFSSPVEPKELGSRTEYREAKDNQRRTSANQVAREAAARKRSCGRTN